MAKFTSHYPELTVYHEGVAHQFRGGQYETDDKDVVAYLRELSDVQEIEAEDTPKRRTSAK